MGFGLRVLGCGFRIAFQERWKGLNMVFELMSMTVEDFMRVQWCF